MDSQDYLNILLDEKLRFSWSPCGFYLGRGDEYEEGPIGRRGPGTTEEEATKPILITKIPSSLIVYINIGYSCESSSSAEGIPSAQEYRQKISDLLKKLKYDEGDTIKIVETGPIIESLRKVKPEHQAEVDRMNKKNTQIRDEFDEIISRLQELGCDTDEIIPVYERIPDEYYNWEKVSNFTSCFKVFCHEHTIF